MHRHRIRVRYAETDQMGVAHHSAYVAWLEEARIEWLRSVGRSYRDLEASGLLLPVVDLRIRYLRAVRFDDLVELITTVTPVGPSRLTFTTRLELDGRICAEAEVTTASVDRQGRPVRTPADMLTLAAP